VPTSSPRTLLGDAQIAADVVRDVLDSLWARRDELTDDDLGLEPILLATRAAALKRRATQPVKAGALRAGTAQLSWTSRNRVELAQAGAAVLGADDTSALELHLRHGIRAERLSATLGISTADAPQRLAQLRSRLDDALATFTLWRNGRPACAGLAAAVRDGTAARRRLLDILVFDVVSRHRASCAECARTYRCIVDPAGMFVAAPLIAVLPSMRDRMLPPGDATSLSTEPVALPDVDSGTPLPPPPTAATTTSPTTTSATTSTTTPPSDTTPPADTTTTTPRPPPPSHPEAERSFHRLDDRPPRGATRRGSGARAVDWDAAVTTWRPL
jgi:hypothetical protein